jgi:uncharacterized membrane protein YsdA (DUF1294 family)
MNPLYILTASYVAINLLSFLVMAVDKRKSTVGNTTERTPEGVLFFLAAAFGSLGIYLAMQTLRHKTKKWYFQIGIPLMIVQNISILYVFSEVLKSA